MKKYIFLWIGNRRDVFLKDAQDKKFSMHPLFGSVCNFNSLYKELPIEEEDKYLIKKFFNVL